MSWNISLHHSVIINFFVFNIHFFSFHQTIKVPKETELKFDHISNQTYIGTELKQNDITENMSWEDNYPTIVTDNTKETTTTM